MQNPILILDFGSQYTQVLARRVRECHVYSKIIPFNSTVEEILAYNPRGIILSGGPASVLDPSSPRPDSKIFDLDLPILGICYGMQLMAHLLGGAVENAPHREYGYGNLEKTRDCPLLDGIQAISVWNSHGDRIAALPDGFVDVARTENADHSVIYNDEKRRFGIQFHPEVAHTEKGTLLLENFLLKICGCTPNWVMSSYIETAVNKIREQVGDNHVVLGLSGGVDSSVAAALLHRAIGDQLHCVFVDNGLLRKNESAEVHELFAEHFHMNLHEVNAADDFLASLKGIDDPEKKRKAIGHTFIKAFEQAIRTIGNIKFLAQGTIYPDVIESMPIGDNPASVIKSHHNVGGLPEDLGLELVEPLRELFKDEVRLLGEELGLPHRLLYRHPFPGPGLGVRVLGEVKPEYLPILREADAILIQELYAANIYYDVWQAFCAFLPVKSVGVKGDERVYEYTIAVRIVESQDAMTADWARIPHDILQKISSRILNEVSGITRVVYDITSKPPGTIEWE